MKLYKHTIALLTALQFLSVGGYAQEAAAGKEETAGNEETVTVNKEKEWQDIFTYRPALFFERALMGEETGVYTSLGGFVGNSGNLMIRGLNTINLNASPYVIISGMPVKHTRNASPFVGGLMQNNWGFINPLDVKRVNVVKGGYYASFYGGKSGNGMIDIDFDRGNMGSATIDFMMRMGFSQADYSFDVLDPTQFRGYLYSMMESRGILPTDLQKMNIFDASHPKYNHHTDWLNDLTGNGFYQDYNLKMKGGDGNTRYLFSLSYASEDETLKESDYQRFNMRFNLDYKISPKISISNSLSYNYTTLHFAEEGADWDMHPVYLGLTKAPFLSPWHYTDEGVKIIRYEGVDELGKSNPYVFKDNLTNKGIENRVDAIIRGRWDFREDTYVSTDIDVSYNGALEKQHRAAEGIVADENRERQNSKRNFSEFLLHWSLDLHHRGRIRENMPFEVGAGMAMESYNEKMVYGRTINSATDEIESLTGKLDSVDNNRYDYKQLNFYVNGKLNLGSRVQLAANVNMERSSNFGPDGKWNLYAGVDVNVNLLQNTKHLLNLDLQWGRTGNNNIQEPYYSQLYLPDHYYGYGAVYLGNLRNDDLKPEITSNYDAALHAGLWKHSVDVNVGYYYRRTKGLLVQRALPIEMGMIAQYENNGEVVNQGVEIAANVKVLDRKNTRWSLFANVTTLDNQVKKLPNGEVVRSYDKFTGVAREKEALGSFFGYKVLGVYQNEGEVNLKRTDGLPFLAGDFHFEDVNKDGIINGDDRQIIGSPLPDFYGGFGTDFRYRDFSLNVLFTYSYGNDVYNLFAQRMSSMEDYSNQSSAILNRWISPEVPGDGTLPRAAYGDPSGNAVTCDRWVEDGSYLKLRSVSLNYNVPLRDRSGFIKGIDVFVNANNLFTVTGYSGFDPEVFSSVNPLLRGVDTGASPVPRSYIFGIKLSL